MIELSVVGAGWRAEFFLRIAQALPSLFAVRSVVARSEARAERLRAVYGVRVVDGVDALFRDGAGDAAVVVLPAAAAPEVTTALVKAGTPVLTETPPAPDVAAMHELWAVLGGDAPVRVAEQYRLQPHHAARLALAGSGVIGPVGYARVSVAHGYHATSLLRLALDAGMESPLVRAVTHLDPAARVHGRDDWHAEVVVRPGVNTIATLDFGDRMGVYEFTGEQYLSPIRGRHLTIRGERGEIADDAVAYVRGPRDVVRTRIVRDDTGLDGDLAGHHLRGLDCDGRRAWTNPFGTARLSDDELAGAGVLAELAEFVRTGGDGGGCGYGLAEAAQDQYLAALIDEAAASGEAVRAEPQPWAKR
ncbi:Gfo/Idh/MocA family oxidoreductase [Jiangella mangrovi]|uniref:Putative dehydrogenase n=1 Tax=Jiangella mangrovi TaxID=1524084 RepID=A0A7W9GWW4_9ACTN|nr:Gfo/Idh/MocA family oxidoreductase [Jiangella mangrovi]MBB5791259.1 putative dehydrogenase [Jiangella mangrovi]